LITESRGCHGNDYRGNHGISAGMGTTNRHFTVFPRGWGQHYRFYRGNGDRNIIITAIIMSHFNKKDLFIQEYEVCLIL